MVKPKLRATFLDEPHRPCVIVKGRDAWALQELTNAGQSGCTPIVEPAPRWSAYVFNLRRVGIHIETVHEPHQGQFPGTHARYVLRSRMSLVPVEQEVTA